jgi:hypothetical protein
LRFVKDPQRELVLDAAKQVRGCIGAVVVDDPQLPADICGNLQLEETLERTLQQRNPIPRADRDGNIHVTLPPFARSWMFQAIVAG